MIFRKKSENLIKIELDNTLMTIYQVSLTQTKINIRENPSYPHNLPSIIYSFKV
jgi:hypothetical protein